MYRCAFAACAAAIVLIAAPAQAQVHRPFPAQALRGEFVVLQTPDVLVNGKAARLAPGARVRGDTNLLQQPAALSGQKMTVHYTIDMNGMVMDVWILNPAELANKTWPQTPQEAANWLFDPAAQTWTRR